MDADEFISNLQGRTLSKLGDLQCDHCSAELSARDEVQMYASDTTFTHHESSGIKVCRTYCQSCANGRIQLPHLGSNELLLEAEIEKDSTRLKVGLASVLDDSPERDGVPWSPREVVGDMLGVDADFFFNALPVVAAAEDVYDLFRVANVDVAEGVDAETGAFNASEVSGEVDMQPDFYS